MRVSSARVTSFILVLVFWVAAANAIPQGADGVNSTKNDSAGGNPAQIFLRGQQALARGELTAAEKDFRQVLELDPQAGAAYSNLGVVYMRRKQWDKALTSLHKAEHLMPREAGIRLNIGLAYFRQNEFLKAIPPLESVVREQPSAVQPRYLLGLCYFFAQRWRDAADTLEPLWDQESGQFPYLYVLSNAAHRAGLTELDNRAANQLLKVGNDTAEYHLFAAKSHLNSREYDLAITELQAAEKANPKLPFIHFNLGLAYLGKQQYADARDEFLKDAALEPDLALDYEELGGVYWLMQDDAKAEKNYREALRLDPRLANSHLGLAKIYQRQQKFPSALAEADAALKVDPERTDGHYVRGQVLLHLGRKEEAKKELAAAARAGEKQQETVPSPELLGDSQ